MSNVTALTQNALESLALCLETMAFISLQPAEEPYTPPADPVLVQIDFDGPATGTLQLCTASALGTLIAQAVADEDSAAITPHDALKELMNMVAGTLLRNAGIAQDFSIYLPHIRSNLTDEEWAEFTSSPDASVVDAEGVLAAIRLSIREHQR